MIKINAPLARRAKLAVRFPGMRETAMNHPKPPRYRAAILPMLNAVLLVASLHPCRAQETGDTVSGHQLAERWCSSCHVIGPTQESGSSNGAPTFAAIARMKSTTSLALHAFLQTPHGRMPDLHLTRDEIDDVSAYILSLRGK